MNLQELLKDTKKPGLYEPGNAVMWTDPYISRQVLDIHLNEHIDLGSRKPDTIQNTVDWILSQTREEKLRILDLGCGPGLYSTLLAQKGHEVTGVDFSENSISYARKEAQKNKLEIRYLYEDYTKLDLPENSFDVVMLIFTDFGPLLPESREQLLSVIRKVMKPGGLFVFDILNDKDIKSMVRPKSWEASEKGFWSKNRYLLLSESFLYEEEKVILYQNIVIEDHNTKVYRFWTHFFADSDLEEILGKSGFGHINFHHNVVPTGDGYESKDVTVCTASISLD